MEAVLVIGYVAVVIATGAIASRKERNVAGWVVFALFGNIFALAAIALLPSLKGTFRPGITKIPDSVLNREIESGGLFSRGSSLDGEPAASATRCYRCGATPPSGAAYCPSCGAALGRRLTADIASEPLNPLWSADAPPPLPKEASTKAPQPKETKAKPGSPIPGLIVLGVAGFFIWRACSGPDDPKPIAQSAPPPQTTVSPPAASPAPVAIPSIAATPEPLPPPAPPKPHMATIDPGATNPITPGGKLSKQLGTAWTARVNAAFVAAANRAARSPLCEEVRLTGYSFDRSEPRKHFSVFADCASGTGQERFYMTEAETKLETPPESVRQIVDRADGFMSCVNVVREKMKFPSTLDYSLWGSNTERSPYGEMGVSLSFTAMNSLGAELPYRAYCIIDDRGVLLQSVKPR